MKYTLIVLLAGLWSTGVIAAPSTPNFSFHEYSLEHGIFIDIAKDLEQFVQTVKCIQNVITKVIVKSELKEIWEQTKHELEKLVNVQWQECAKVGDVAEQTKCKAAVIKNGAEVLTTFVKVLAEANKWELVKKIKEMVIAKCFQTQTELFGFEDKTEQFNDAILTQFECLANVLGTVSKAHGLDDLWSKSKPQLEHHLGKWKQCNKADNSFFVAICKVKEGAISFAIVSEYLKLAIASDPKFVQDFGNQYKENCADKSKIDELTEMFVVEGVEGCVQKFVDKIKCVSEAIREAVKDTEFQEVWDASKQDVVNLQNQLSACKNETCSSAAAKCITKAFENTFKIFGKFLLNMKQANHEAYSKVKENIKKKCYA